MKNGEAKKSGVQKQIWGHNLKQKYPQPLMSYVGTPILAPVAILKDHLGGNV
jgi:hypothetical protein